MCPPEDPSGCSAGTAAAAFLHAAAVNQSITHLASLNESDQAFVAELLVGQGPHLAHLDEDDAKRPHVARRRELHGCQGLRGRPSSARFEGRRAHKRVVSIAHNHNGQVAAGGAREGAAQVPPNEGHPRDHPHERPLASRLRCAGSKQGGA